MKIDGIDLVDGNILKNMEAVNITAWVNFNGTGVVTIRDSYNISSVTDRGPGAYTVNFAVAMNNVDFSVTATARILAAPTHVSFTDNARTVNSFEIDSFNHTPADADATMFNINICGGV